MAAIKDYVAFYWDRVDSWYEEDDEIFVHPRDPYKRVEVLNSFRPVRVIVGGETVAQTRRARFLFETRLPTRYYMPPEDVRMDPMVPSKKITACPYKGKARYYSVKVGDRLFKTSPGAIRIRSRNAPRSEPIWLSQTSMWTIFSWTAFRSRDR